MVILKNILTELCNIIKDILDRFFPTGLSNFEYNKRYWNKCVRVERSRIERFGDDWAKPSDVERIIEEYIYPFITKESIVAEIGSGVARVASKVADKTKEFYCFDISYRLLEKAKIALAAYPHVSYVLLDRPQFPTEFTGKFDFVYAFDVFVHLDLHTMWKYFKEINIILKKGGRAFIHTTNLKSPGGWEQFSSQKVYSPETHYFVSPEIIGILAQHSNLKIIKSSTVDPNNMYLNKSYMVILEK